MTSLLGKVLMSLLLSTATVSVWASSATLVLFPIIRPATQESVTAKASIELTKVARVIAPRAEQKSLSELELPVATLLGRRQIPKAELVALLRTLPALADMEIVGPELITVVTPADPAAVQQILKEATAALQEHVAVHWQDRYRNVELAYRGDGDRLPVGHGSTWSFDFSAIEYLSRRTPVWLVVRQGSEIERAILWFKVSGDEWVWQSVASLEAKAVVDEQNFVQRWVSLNDIKPQELAEPSDRQRLTVAMQAGDVLTDRYLELIPDVEFGEDALVISKVGDVEIRSVATVMRTAYVGETVQLQSKSSKQNFEAQVVDKNLVQINPAQGARN